MLQDIKLTLTGCRGSSKPLRYDVPSDHSDNERNSCIMVDNNYSLPRQHEEKIAPLLYLRMFLPFPIARATDLQLSSLSARKRETVLPSKTSVTRCKNKA